MAEKPFTYAFLEAITQEMRSNPYLSLIWEMSPPVASLPTGEVLNPAQEFGSTRCMRTAIDEAWIVGAASGAALTGVPVVAKIPQMCPIFSQEQVFNQISKLRAMTGGQASMPIVLWQDGAGRTAGPAAQHNDVGHEAVYTFFPGVKVVIPSNSYDAKGLMISAIRDEDPVVIYNYTEVNSGKQPDVPDEAYTVPIGKAAVRQEGTDLTIVAWAPASVDVAKALPDIEKEGISAEYIDLRTLKPMDTETLFASVEKTGRLLVVEHGPYTNGFGSFVVSEVAQNLPGTKARRITFPDAPGPAAREMIAWMRPDAPKIVDAAIKMMNW